VRSVVEQRLAAEAGGTWRGLGAFLGDCGSDAIRHLITEAVTEERNLPNPEQQLADVLLRLRNEHLEREFAAVIQQAGQPEVADEKKVELLQRSQELLRQKRSPLVPIGG